MFQTLYETLRTAVTNPRGLRRSDAWIVICCALALPALVQLSPLVAAFWSRFGFPFDLEWLDGQMMTGALRMARGQSYYHAPNLDFIPALYTPLYPAVLAAIGTVAGISYQLGRAVSIACFVGVAVLAGTRWIDGSDGIDVEPAVPAAAVLGLGYFGAAYPWLQGWYDICRPDMLMCLLGFAGLAGVCRSGLHRRQRFWRPDVAGWAALIALSFFAKQTGIFFVAAGGVGLLILDWRALPAYVLAAGAVGLGGTGLLVLATDGWFWTFAYEYHQHHDTSREAFVEGLYLPLARFPGLYGFVVLGTFAAVIERFLDADERRSADCALFWVAVAILGLLAGAVGYATQWSYYNAFVPAVFTAVFALAATASSLFNLVGRLPRRTAALATIVLLAALGGELIWNRWPADDFVPDRSEWKHGRALVDRMESVDGPVFAPLFPWYTRLAGKRLFVHQNGVNDVTTSAPGDCDDVSAYRRWMCPDLERRAYEVPELHRAIDEARFAAIFHSPSYDYTNDFDQYEYVEWFSKHELPTPPSGTPTADSGLWVREKPAELPENARMVFDFESKTLPEWELTGDAWGDGPTTGPLGQQQPVGGYTGGRFMNSFHGGDGPTGTARSPVFELDGSTLHLQVGGGRDPEDVRVELRSTSGEVLRSATGRDSEMMREVIWDVSGLRGREVRLALVDESSAGWGHLLVDSIWIEG
ncbi:MAG: hypothetical protein ABEL76_14010 [Bradymonadaceae bacterium]